MTTDNERDDILETLAKHRGLLKQTVRGISDADAARRTTVSALCLGGLIKHVTRMETRWASFIQRGPDAMAMTPDAYAAHEASFRMEDDETLAGLVETYDEVAAATDDLIRTVESLDMSHPLPKAPWFEPGARWTVRRVAMHLIAETAQHAGHADILRETIDGAKTMG
jgi:uncharacterized damage-inducible protein DinB